MSEQAIYCPKCRTIWCSCVQQKPPCPSCASLQSELSACREQLDEALQSAMREVARLETEAMERQSELAKERLQSALADLKAAQAWRSMETHDGSSDPVLVYDADHCGCGPRQTVSRWRWHVDGLGNRTGGSWSGVSKPIGWLPLPDYLKGSK